MRYLLRDSPEKASDMEAGESTETRASRDATQTNVQENKSRNPLFYILPVVMKQERE